MKKKKEREAIFSTITAKAEKIKSIVPESYPILFKQGTNIRQFLLEKAFLKKNSWNLIKNIFWKHM